MINGDFKCGGVLVSTTAALTAAQCVNGWDLPIFPHDFSSSNCYGVFGLFNWILYSVTVSTITARAGSAFRTSQGTLKTVSSVVIHSSYSSTTYDYDIAVLKIATAFTLGTTIGVATLPSVNEIVSAGSVAQVSGWGITTVRIFFLQGNPHWCAFYGHFVSQFWQIGGTSFPGYLQVASVPVVANSVCSAAYTRINAITDRMICAGYTTGGVDVCEVIYSR